MPETKPDQRQILASWRSLLGGASALIRMGREDAALLRIDEVRTQMFLAQIFGLPDADPLPEEDQQSGGQT